MNVTEELFKKEDTILEAMENDEFWDELFESLGMSEHPKKEALMNLCFTNTSILKHDEDGNLVKNKNGRNIFYYPGAVNYVMIVAREILDVEFPNTPKNNGGIK